MLDTLPSVTRAYPRATQLCCSSVAALLQLSCSYPRTRIPTHTRTHAHTQLNRVIIHLHTHAKTHTRSHAHLHARTHAHCLREQGLNYAHVRIARKALHETLES